MHKFRVIADKVYAMADLTRPDRLQIMLNAEEVRALDDWRFAHRMPSRAAAVRELLKRGLMMEGVQLETDGRQSTSFGVVAEEAHAGAKTSSRARPSDREEAR
jgi:hypothetical protein